MPVNIIASSIQKVKGTLRMVSGQMLLVFAAFAIMALVSYLFMSNIERRHLLRDVDNVISNTQTNIEADFMEPRTTLGIIAETIREMILHGGDFDAISKYITEITNYMFADDRLASYTTGVYGVFDVFDGQFCAGIDWAPPGNYAPRNRPWYKAAIDANGAVGITEPYIDMVLGVTLITFARQIFDKEGRPLGVVCLNVTLDRIRGHAINSYVTDDSYGILMDNQLRVLAHPHPAYLGRSIRNMNDGPAIEEEIKAGRDISERKATDYNGNQSVLFSRQLKNGWYMAVLAYAKKYYQSVTRIGIILGLLGMGMAILLNIILLRIAAEKQKSDAENRQKSNFLATVSHEIRTPMNAILGIAEIQMNNKALPHDTNIALTKIYQSGYSLLGIINDVLDLSKIEAGKLELIPIKYDVASLIHDTAQLNMMRIGSKRIKFELQVDPFTPTELFGDELRIKQILNNLLSNAFKYTQTGEVVLSVVAKYEDRVKNPHVSLVINVSDTGQGMTQEQIRKLFDEYSRFNLETNRLTEGIGLGMSITRRLVQMMNGSISVQSEPGKGTTFTVYLPQGNVGAPPLGKEAVENLRQFRFNENMAQVKTTQIVREPMPYGSVLIVDDVETNLYVAKGLLAPYELSIDTAMSGFETIDKIKAGRVYDIIFMDHMMPKMDGLETTKNLRSMGYSYPIIALTANAVTGQAEMFMSNGFNDFLSKPIDIRQLNALLIKLIRDKQPPEVLQAAQEKQNRRVAEKASQPTIDSDLARTFIRDAEKAVRVLNTIHEKSDAFEDDDIQLYTITTHAMKSALANIGEAALSDFARKLETAGRERDVNTISAETPAFLNDLQTVIKKIAPPEEDDSGKTEAENLDLLREKLLLFRAACVVYDKKAAKDVIIELKKESWSRQTRELLNTLTEHLLHSDFEEAANIARDYDFDSAG